MWSRRSPRPEEDRTAELDVIGAVLDPVLTPLHFAPAQVGTGQTEGQAIFCRGLWDSTDGGCIDLVLDLRADPEWRIVDVRYWGFADDRWHLAFDPGAPLPDQLRDLAERLPPQLDEPVPPPGAIDPSPV